MKKKSYLGTLGNEGVPLLGPRLSSNQLSFSASKSLSPPRLPHLPRLPRLRQSQTTSIAIVFQLLLSTSKIFPATMALQLLHTTSHLPAFSGLRAAPSVPQVNNKLSRVGCVRRSSALQSINSVMNPLDDPILKEALKEPIAFLGGVFAGLLRLDLNEEPLKNWVAKTAEAAGIDLDESQAFDTDDSIPEDIRID